MNQAPSLMVNLTVWLFDFPHEEEKKDTYVFRLRALGFSRPTNNKCSHTARSDSIWLRRVLCTLCAMLHLFDFGWNAHEGASRPSLIARCYAEWLAYAPGAGFQNAAYIHSKLKMGMESIRESRLATSWLPAGTIVMPSGTQPRIRWESGISIVMLWDMLGGCVG